MANVWGVLVLATLMVAVCSAQSPDEPCVKDAYPPDPKSDSLFCVYVSVLVFCPRPCSTEVPTYTVDLDQDPKLRWQKLVTDKKADVSEHFSVCTNCTFFSWHHMVFFLHVSSCL